MKGFKKVIIVFLGVFFVPFLKANDLKAKEGNLSLVDNSFSYISIIERVIDKRTEGNYGWEGDVGTHFSLFKYENLSVDFDGKIEAISRNHVFRANFLTVNFNLAPSLMYKKGNQKFGIMLNHWSRHYNNLEIGVVNNNLIGPKYIYSSNKKVWSIDKQILTIFFGWPVIKNDKYFDYLFDFQAFYKMYIGRVYVSSFLELAQLSWFMFDLGYELGSSFNIQKNYFLDLFFGYRAGLIVPPSGVYGGIRLNF